MHRTAPWYAHSRVLTTDLCPVLQPQLSKQRGFNLLAARPQEGWDEHDRGNLQGLLKAYFMAFSSADDVALYIELQGEQERSSLIDQAMQVWRRSRKVSNRQLAVE